MGSADMMPRNLDRRIEVLVPIERPVLVDRLHAIVRSWQADERRSWLLDSTGHWTRGTYPPHGLDSQQACYDLARSGPWPPPL
jgi:polyphosphate kinase